ncbi:hypothetical protein DVR12_14425 [Chitinophaga silvatica]|uniref:Uncharacterized protein n=1 Tax=Chitinophaga silvatica TaxID=2282649 RepID=A0A3E1Y8V1_9BACT|nr:Arm DNA-binding domain-containing protein [Chitinophaga silvatica]RFS21848.1 hypothetical protein DVR12_14425 [Chitinophaga silvatica]
MLLPIKLICPKSKVRRDGTCLIFIQYCGKAGKSTLLNTEIAIPPKFWNRKFLRISPDLPETYGQPQHLNEQLATVLRLAGDIIAHATKEKIADVGQFVKQTFCAGFDVKKLELQAIANDPNRIWIYFSS